MAPFRKSTIVERRQANSTSLAAVLYGIDFYSDEPHPISLQVPAFLEKTRRFELWDPARPTRGLPRLPDTHFEKAHGAPFFRKPFQRSTPQTKPESDQIGGMPREANHPHLHFHIFASLPGLNGSANNRHRFRLLMNVEFLNYYRIQKKQGGVRLICLVKAGIDLRPHRLNH